MGKVQNKKKVTKVRQSVNPTGVPTSNEILNDLANVNDEVAIDVGGNDDEISVLKNLKSPTPSDRVWAVSSISNLFSDPAYRKLLYSKGAVGLLVKCLSDTNLEVVVEAMGAIRNLLLFDPSCAASLPFQVVAPVLMGVLERVNPEDIIFQLTDGLVSLLTALSSVSAQFTKALTAIPITPMLSFLFSIITSQSHFPSSVLVSTFVCLSTVFEDNSSSHSVVPHDILKTAIFLILQEEPRGRTEKDAKKEFELKIAAAGLLIVLKDVIKLGSFDDMSEWMSRSLNIVGTIVSEQSNLLDDTKKYLSVVAAAPIKTAPSSSDDEEQEPANDAPQMDDAGSESINQKINLVSLSLELLANMVPLLIEDREDEEAVWDEVNDDNVMDEEMKSDEKDLEEPEQDLDDTVDVNEIMELSQAATFGDSSISDATILESITNSQTQIQKTFASLVPYLISISSWYSSLISFIKETVISATPSSNSNPQQPNPIEISKKYLSQYKSLHLRSLSVLSNLFFGMIPTSEDGNIRKDIVSEYGHTLPVVNWLFNNPSRLLIKPPQPTVVVKQYLDQAMNQLETLYTVMTSSSALTSVFLDSGNSDFDPLLTVLFSLLKSLDLPYPSPSFGVKLFFPVTAHLITGLIGLYNNASVVNDEARAKIIGILGVLGKQQGQECIEINKQIAHHLHQILTTPTLVSAQIIIASLNAIFDIYSDASYDYDSPVFVSSDFLGFLKKIDGSVKKAVKMVDKRKNKGLREDMEMAWKNMRRFIQYKESERRKTV
ncbi:hypothetical protein BKA69DRAFT_1063963 [Paraphysoderma sedebokerense]|nr:hypothetical protein BKA69DRAFT_1063963 [Paraphysoderma sedebokerense]